MKTEEEIKKHLANLMDMTEREDCQDTLTQVKLWQKIDALNWVLSK